MSSPVLLKLSRVKPAEEITVNMARVLFLRQAEVGTAIHMNIPDSVLYVKETPHDIRHMTKEAQTAI